MLSYRRIRKQQSTSNQCVHSKVDDEAKYHSNWKTIDINYMVNSLVDGKKSSNYTEKEDD